MTEGQPTPEQIAEKILNGGPIVAAASEATAQLVASALNAATSSIKNLVETNTNDSPMARAIQELSLKITAAAAKLAQERVNQVVSMTKARATTQSDDTV